MTDLAYHDGTLRPLDQITVGIRTHALHYGTGVFEGIRAYWNAEAEQLYAFRLADHYARLCASAKVYGMQASLSVEELCDVTIDLLARNEVREDVYIRPLVFKSSETMGLWSQGLTDSLVIYHVPLGAYISESGIRCCVSSWRRPDGNFVPARAKISGIYAGMALARREALQAERATLLRLRNERLINDAVLTRRAHSASFPAAGLFRQGRKARITSRLAT